ncbi:hypothetical protein [Winogradskyella sp. KYW1333]|uniref:hypothetical protein n=1 Tax=Winogradskyella sp. KYW1333 TaxID=2282123 RepID=UPI000DF1EEB7|nr:hypothetical protein [Winogradskyella sp. KYW1333]RCT55704.1 hypothetical protein DUZ96_03005 [Winogradskyella sp. KYW1333]
MKKLILTALVASTLVFTGCFKDDDTPIIVEETTIINNNNPDGGEDCPVVPVTGLIATSTTWTADNIYQLNQKVVVGDGVTLTINPGTIIKGSAGTGSLASALIVARGGTLNAQGTADQPIIFTSTSDNITCGQTAGTNLDQDDRGLWGGLIVLGYAPCSFSGDIVEAQIEGIPADDTFGLYGGTDPDDSSGAISYVSIRHGGALIGEGNEINGLTLGGVGAGTLIDNIEVVANVDDGIEFFGGTVDASNLLVWAQGDDAIDIDQAYSGTVDNAVVVLGDISDHAFEIDGPEGTGNGAFTLRNATIIGNTVTSNGEYADYRSNAQGLTENIFAFGFKDSSDVELDNDGVATNYNDGLLTFGTWEIVLPEGVTDVADIFVNKAENVMVTGFGSTATAVTAGSETVGATTSNLSWTFSNEAGGLGF